MLVAVIVVVVEAIVVLVAALIFLISNDRSALCGLHGKIFISGCCAETVAVVAAVFVALVAMVDVLEAVIDH